MGRKKKGFSYNCRALYQIPSRQMATFHDSIYYTHDRFTNSATRHPKSLVGGEMCEDVEISLLGCTCQNGHLWGVRRWDALQFVSPGLGSRIWSGMI